MSFVKAIRSTALVLAASLLAAAAPAQTTAPTTWKIDPVHSGVEFKVRHLGVSYVHGTFTHPTGIVRFDENNLAKSSVEATVDTTTVTTNETARDNHLKSDAFFNIAKFPAMSFKSTSLYKEGGKWFLKGDLTLTGVTKPVILTLDGPAPPQTDAKGVTRSGFSATGTVNRSDFNFGTGFPAPTIGDEVTFTIDIEMDKQ
jgi:polyisoprenoid-binding protein YceI